MTLVYFGIEMFRKRTDKYKLCTHIARSFVVRQNTKKNNNVEFKCIIKKKCNKENPTKVRQKKKQKKNNSKPKKCAHFLFIYYKAELRIENEKFLGRNLC